MAKKLRRAPNGVETNRPIAVRLRPDERTVVEQLAQADDRSSASLCRLAVLDYLRRKGALAASA